MYRSMILDFTNRLVFALPTKDNYKDMYDQAFSFARDHDGIVIICLDSHDLFTRRNHLIDHFDFDTKAITQFEVEAY
ncbi:hypothetical protein [Ligilactobacillus agilis]|uniref:hypothetical protein n=1 Tax=Ligilactobacillus agilis TaxID=1601 RepID=UPI000B8D55B7|nr:hypothetical protein [Ligilactobacillus agilis]ASR40869.1 hypothetical protein BEN83_04925 [Ligilactobacillus agilis]MBL1056942.1 hypothetical protein [Ligilactobacillus agilis]